MTFGEFIRHPSTGPLLDRLLGENRKVDAINAGVAIYHRCLCGARAHLDDVRSDGVCAYRCPNPSCVYRVALVAPMGGA